MITGQIQVGNKRFIPYYPAELTSPVTWTTSASPRLPMPVSVAFTSCLRPVSGVDQLVTETINRLGQVGTGTWAAKYGVKYAYQEPATKHNIPDVFWSFLNL